MTDPAGVRGFFVDSLGRALELGLATPDDVLAHATPDVLATHLPRPVWAKLLAACLTAPRTDARLVVDTITVPVLCEWVPAPLLWACLAQVATRALGRGLVAPPPPLVAAPPPAAIPAAVASAPSAPVASVAAPSVAAPSVTAAIPVTPAPASARAVEPRPVVEPRTAIEPPTAELAAEVTRVAPTPARPAPPAPLPAAPTRAATSDGARPVEPAPLEPPPSTRPGAARTTLGARRPQAAAAMPARRADARADARPPSNRAATATDFEIEADVGEAWRKEPEQVDDDQLIDWSQSEETMTGSEGVAPERRR